MAEISNDRVVGTLQLTKEILTELGIPGLIKPPMRQSTGDPSDRIEAYAKHFRQLWKVLVDPTVE